MNILLIEDDAGLVELITTNLEELGFSVLSAASGAEGLAHLKNQSPDLMLLDYLLPDINGKELIETLIEQQTPLPPYVIITGQGDQSIAVNMMKLGAMDYLVKDKLFLKRIPKVIKHVIKEIENDDKLKQIEQALKQSEERFDLAMAATKDSLFDFNLVTNEIFYSPVFKSKLGYKEEELASDVATWEKVTRPEDMEALWKMQQEVINKQRDRFELEIQMQHKDGHWIDMLTRADIIFDENDTAIRMVGTNVDITERKREEKILAVELKLFEYAINHSEEELLQKFLDEAEKLTNSEIGFYHYVEDDQESISLQTWSSNTLNNMCKGTGEATRHYPISMAGVWVDCVKERKPVIHNDYSSLAHKKGLPEGHAPIIRELVVPVIRGNQIKAVLGVGNKKSDYSEADVKCIKRLADTAWETVVRKQTEEKQLESEKFLKEVMESMLDGFSILDENGVHTEVNKAFCKMTGFAKEELIGIGLPHPYWPEEEYENIQKAFLNTSKGIFENFELVFKKKNGKRFPVLISPSQVKDKNGDVVSNFATVMDITNRKRAEELLIESETQLKFAQQSAGAGLWDWDIKTDKIKWSPELFSLFGFDSEQEDTSFETWDKCMHPDDKESANERLNISIKEHTQLNNEYRVVHPNGNVVWINAIGNTSYDDEGNPIRNAGICIDITERKLAEEEIQKSNDLLSSVIDSPENVIMLALDTNYNYLSFNRAHVKEMKNIYNADIEIGNNVFSYMPNEEDTRKSDISYKRALKGERFVDIQEYGKAESRFWYELIYNPILDTLNQVTGLTIFVTNITEQRLVEENLRESEKFSREIIESLSDGFSILDENGVHIDVNPAFCKMTGFAKEELIGVGLPYPYWPEEEYENIQEAFKKTSHGNFESFELVFKKKNGKRFTVLVSPSQLKDENGDVVNNFAHVMDITERKQIEKELLNYQVNLEKTVQKRTKELQNKNEELDSSLKVFVGREIKIRELQTKLDALTGA